MGPAPRSHPGRARVASAVQDFGGAIGATRHGAQPLAEVLAGESTRFGRNCTLVIITAALDERWVISLQHLLYRGVRAVVILVDPHSFGGWRDTLGVQARLAELRVPTYLFQQGQSLPDALAHPALLGAAVTR